MTNQLNKRLRKINVRVNEFKKKLKKKINVDENVWKFVNKKRKIDNFVVEKKKAQITINKRNIFFIRFIDLI